MALKRHAWIGGAAGLMALGIFGTYAWRAKDAELSDGWMALGATGLVLVLIWVWLDRARLSEVTRSRAAKQSGFAFVLTLVAGGIMAPPPPGSTMPPKCTWFEPKLRSGLLTYLL